MKRFFSVILCLLLVFGLLPVTPSVAAEDTLSADEAAYGAYSCHPIPGGEVKASELSDGSSYVLQGDASLILDADRTFGALCCTGNLTLEGNARLSADVLYAEGGVLTVESGVIVCPALENPPDRDLIFVNGLCGFGGVVVNGGSIECPEISGCSETVTINGGTVKADTIGALFGYTQKAGSVEAATVRAREGVFVKGGSLNAGELIAWIIDVSGGVSMIQRITPTSGDEAVLCMHFPMTITEPTGARYWDGKLIDAQHSEVEKIKIEKVSVAIPFRDVSKDSYYYGSVGWALYRNVTRGMTDTQFEPNRTCTRAQAVTFLWRAAGCPAPKTSACLFRDIAPGAYYYDAVLWAVENGITQGMTETAFAPDQPCTRGQIVTFLWRSEGAVPSELDEPWFDDVPKSSYCADAVDWARIHGITNGTSADRFSPDQPCTRAQIVTFLARLFNNESIL